MVMVEKGAGRSRELGMLVVSLAACFGVSALGASWASQGLSPWYEGLSKPSWNPPGWVFGPVWVTLYILMAVAAWMIWRVRERPGAWVALGLYVVQLALNLAWTGIFFTLKLPGPALFEIALLWVMILATIVAFGRVRPWAGALLVPYLVWVSFASALNFMLWRLNG